MFCTSRSKLSSPVDRRITRSTTKTGQPSTPTHTASMADPQASTSGAPYLQDKRTRRKASPSYRRRVVKSAAKEIPDSTYRVGNAANTIFLFQLTQIYRPETVFWSTSGLKENGSGDQERWPTCAPSVESQRQVAFSFISGLNADISLWQASGSYAYPVLLEQRHPRIVQWFDEGQRHIRLCLPRTGHVGRGS